jgi:N-methylhydantoinase A
MLSQLEGEGFSAERISLRRSIDMRYRRQVHILTVPVLDSGALSDDALEQTIQLFERLYEEKYGKESAYREAGIELVSFRLRGEGAVRKPEFTVQDVGDRDGTHAITKTVEAWVDKNAMLEQVHGYDFNLMRPGNALEGPAIVWTPITTLVVAPGQVATVDEYKNLVVTNSTTAPAEPRHTTAVGAVDHG